ncbi:hypothetical protein M408DRAFT_282040 [Serendipita vermifera MAFF 305830]|uniref:Cytochrome P450 n=1 Tax=Serendipita vermifera MAFF 305830 TaxID=933852 RepID=A0A0C3ADD2_SERVB|nr:hypothetical protein M408DRAFT_282040 [Serendipita vermifera MAFF 305830]
MNAVESIWNNSNHPSVVSVYAIAVSTVILILWQYWQNRYSIPTYGGVLSFSRVLSTLKFVRNGREETLRTYKEHPIIVLPRPDMWAATAHSKYVEEIAKAPDDALSFMDAVEESLQMKYTFGPNFTFEHYHVHVIRNQLTRHLSGLFPDVFDETKQAVSDLVGEPENEWKTLDVTSFSQNVVTRASNRIFVGLPLCRNEKWLALMISSAVSIVKVAIFVNMFPAILRPLVGWVSTTVKKRLNEANDIAGPIVEKKLAGGTNAESDDFMSWLISNAPEKERNPHDILSRILMTNFVAIHTSSMTVTNCLYWLLARPQYIESIRQEIEEVTSRLGWSKEAIGAMPKLDSFVKECMRITPIGTQVMMRKVLKPFTFSNGFQAPAGMTISAHLYATHHDESLYSNAGTFDGFRFLEVTSDVKDRKEQGETDTNVRKTMYTTSKTFLAFGHGRHACPGRFFAAMEIKLILAHLIAAYDMKWPDKVYDPSVPGYTKEGYRPPDEWYAQQIVLNRTAEMMIRKRA